jgi:hypothetical protein
MPGRKAIQLKQDYTILIQKSPKALNFHGRYILSDTEVELDRSVGGRSGGKEGEERFGKTGEDLEVQCWYENVDLRPPQK